MQTLNRFTLLAFCLTLLMSTARDGHPQESSIDDRRAALRQLRAELATRYGAMREKATRTAKARGWPQELTSPDGEQMPLWGLSRDGRPLYLAPLLADAGITNSTNLVRDDPTSAALRNPAYNFVDGAGLALAVWDGGLVGNEHPEFTGRVVPKDDNTTHSSHATLVSGTALAAGVRTRDGVPKPDTGMAPAATLWSYTSLDDLIEIPVVARTENGISTETILLSNHSYERSFHGWRHLDFFIPNDFLPFWWGLWPEIEDRRFGSYSQTTHDADAICYAAPYYQPVWAAGNDRSTAWFNNPPDDGETFYRWDPELEIWVDEVYTSATHPLAENSVNGGYDTLIPSAAAKNVLSVGAIEDAITEPGGVRDLSNAVTASFSSWGPTDDGRIKPDLMANGRTMNGPTGLTSGYGSGNGTSYAAPGVSGSALLLQDYYESLHPDEFLRADAVRALLLHHATDIGNPGPDYIYGWGLMDTKACADFLTSTSHSLPATHALLYGWVDGDITQRTYWVEADGTTTLTATVCWTDPPGPVIDALDDRTPRLVHDLDLRISDGVTTPTMPWVLDVENPELNATRGDNTVDNVEQVVLGQPAAGVYQVIVSTKGQLTQPRQDFAIVITGQTATEVQRPNFAVVK
jgi:hypothetical protein